MSDLPTSYPGPWVPSDEETWLLTQPEVLNLAGCAQDSEYHQEGDVLLHTLLVTREMDSLLHISTCTPFMATALQIGAILHDIGKPATTVRQSDGHLTSHGHTEVGAAMVESILSRADCPYKVDERLLRVVRGLVAYHHCHLNTYKKAGLHRLLRHLGNAGIAFNHMAWLIWADSRGKRPRGSLQPLAAMLAEMVHHGLEWTRPYGSLENERLAHQIQEGRQ